MKMVVFDDEEKKELEKCLIISIDCWEERLTTHECRGTREVIEHRIEVLRTALEKLQSV